MHKTCKRLLALVLALALILCATPLTVFANGSSGTSVTVTLGITRGENQFLTCDETGYTMFPRTITVPYFDLALYGLEDFYFADETYGDDGDGEPGSDLVAGTPEYAYGKITLLHLIIYATEIYYCGLSADEAGLGYLKNEELIGSDAFGYSGSVGSIFFTSLFGHSCNLNYYKNYAYPLASSGWGATADQILLNNGDVLSLHMIEDESAYGANFSVVTANDTDGAYDGTEQTGAATVKQGEPLDLTFYYTQPDYSTYATTYVPNANAEVLYAAADAASGDLGDDGWVADGLTTDDNGQVTIDTSAFAPGTYYITAPGFIDYNYMSETASSFFRLTVEAAEVAVSGITLSDASLALEVNGSAQLNATVEPADATDSTVTWSSSDETVATVDATGLVSAVSAGTATITATAGTCSAVCEVTVSAAAADPEIATATVYLSVSDSDSYIVGSASGEVMALKEITVPYFDLANYGLETYYFQSENYGSDSGNIGDNTFEDVEPYENKITPLHLFIYALEVHEYGVAPDKAGQGYLLDEGLIGTDAFEVSGSAGSAFMNWYWGMDSNLMYYENYEYPLASTGWGSTCDQILLEDGSVYTVGHFADMSFYSDPNGIFCFLEGNEVRTEVSAAQGENVELALYRSYNDVMSGSEAEVFAVETCPDVYYTAMDDLSSGNVTDWTYLGTADESGLLTFDTSAMLPGDYLIAFPGQYGEYGTVVSTPGALHLTVTASSEEEITYGDLSGDGEVDMNDISALLKIVDGITAATDAQKTIADVNADGDVDMFDVSVMLQLIDGLITSLPADN